MNKRIDLNPLIGRHYVTKSGNLVTVRVLAQGAFRFDFSSPQSEEDEVEVQKWIESIVGTPPDTTLSTRTDQFNLAEALRDFKQKRKEEGVDD